VLARTSTSEAACSGCGMVSRRVHSSYQRRLADTASGCQEVLIHLRARRFICGNEACAKGTFAEQVPGLTTRYGRRTCGLQAVLQAVALALGGRAGARLTGRLACSASRSTLLRLIRLQTGQGAAGTRAGPRQRVTDRHIAAACWILTDEGRSLGLASIIVACRGRAQPNGAAAAARCPTNSLGSDSFACRLAQLRWPAWTTQPMPTGACTE
jgi:hypothetical protein